MREELAALAKRAIEEKVFPSCVIGVIKSGSGFIAPIGRLTYEESSSEVWEGTIYDLASITKSIPTASLAAMFVAEGRLRLDAKVVEYLPQLQNDHGAIVEDLLRYRVRGPRMSTLGFKTFEQIRTHLLETGFDGPPGEEIYANAPAFILGLVLERVGGMILPALAHKYFFGPLKMTDTTFFPYDLENIAPTEVVDGRELRGIVHDESARLFGKRRRAVGHAGLFSTVPDLLTFFEALLAGRFPAVLEAAEKGLGWQSFGQSIFGKTGFTGTLVAADPKRATALVVLSNRTYPKRPPGLEAIVDFRSKAMKLVFSS